MLEAKRSAFYFLWIPGVLVAAAAAYSFGLVPPEVYGALLGALLTLLGIQLKSRHDVALKRTELEYNLRRDVYLEVAEGIAGSRKYLQQLAQPDVDELKEISGVPPAWLEKLELVSSQSTISSARNAARTYDEIALDLMKRRAKLQKLDFDIKVLRDHHSRLFDLQRETWKNFGDALAEPDEAVRDAKLRAASDAQGQVQQSLDANDAEQKRLSAERSNEHRELARAAIRGAARYGRSIIQLQNALRAEIGAESGVMPSSIPDEDVTPAERQLDDFVDYIEALWRREDDAG